MGRGRMVSEPYGPSGREMAVPQVNWRGLLEYHTVDDVHPAITLRTLNCLGIMV